jgi:cytochrome c556
MRDIKSWCLALAFLAGVPTMSGHADEQQLSQQKLQELMRRKLERSQKVLEGIALNDFEKIADGAADLIQISKAAEWRVLKTPQYEVHSNDFRSSGQTLIQSAKGKNLDGAALAYVELTLTCVKCHKHVREVRMARAD